MTYSNDCVDLVKQFEGCRLTAYQDVAGMWTIGWGCIGPSVREGVTWTQEQADAVLESHIDDAAAAVNNLVKVPLTQNQFDALIDFTYNLGSGTLAHSTLLAVLNSGGYQAVPNQLYHLDEEGNPHGFVFAGGVAQPGLIRRRIAEIDLWNK